MENYYKKYIKYKLKYNKLKTIINKKELCGGTLRNDSQEFYESYEFTKKKLSDLTIFLDNFSKSIINDKYAEPHDLKYILNDNDELIKNIIKYYVYTYDNILINIKPTVDNDMYFKGLDLLINRIKILHDHLIETINKFSDPPTKFILLIPGESMTKLWFVFKIIYPEFLDNINIIPVLFPLSKASSTKNDDLKNYIINIFKNHNINMDDNMRRIYIFMDYISSAQSLINIYSAISLIDKQTNITNKDKIEFKFSLHKKQIMLYNFDCINLTSLFVDIDNGKLFPLAKELLTYLTEETDFEVSRCCPKFTLTSEPKFSLISELTKNDSHIIQYDPIYFRCNVIFYIILLYYHKKEYLLSIIDRVMVNVTIKPPNYIDIINVTTCDNLNKNTPLLPTYELIYYNTYKCITETLTLSSYELCLLYDSFINKEIFYTRPNTIFPHDRFSSDIKFIRPNNILNLEINHLSYDKIITDMKHIYKLNENTVISTFLHTAIETNNYYIIKRLLENNSSYNIKNKYEETPLYILAVKKLNIYVGDKKYSKLIENIIFLLNNTQNRVIELSGSVEDFYKIYNALITNKNSTNSRSTKKIAQLFIKKINFNDIKELLKFEQIHNVEQHISVIEKILHSFPFTLEQIKNISIISNLNPKIQTMINIIKNYHTV